MLPVELKNVLRVPALDQLFLPDRETPDRKIETQVIVMSGKRVASLHRRCLNPLHRRGHHNIH